MLRRARISTGLTQADVAAAAGTSQAAVSTAESRPESVGLGKMRRLLRATGHDLAVVRVDSVDADDDQLMRVNLAMTPEDRLASFESVMALRSGTTC